MPKVPKIRARNKKPALHRRGAENAKEKLGTLSYFQGGRSQESEAKKHMPKMH
jgi:hypothetical protein